MSDPVSPGSGSEKSGSRFSGHTLTLGAALLVVLLAIGGLLWPAGHRGHLQGRVLIFDPIADPVRVEKIYQPLTAFLARESGHDMELEVSRSVAGFFARLEAGADFALCPDGLALSADPQEFEPVVTARRAAPRNLRPRNVLVYRLDSGLIPNPWINAPGRTVVGDSVGLAATGQVLVGRHPGGLDCSWGPDPFDHRPVLHAARLGAFDYAVVRQWDADFFFASQLLSDQEWGQENLTVPVPDIVLLARREISRGIRLDVGQALASLGRTDTGGDPEASALLAGLPYLQLAGFNLLLEPDWERIRGIFSTHWHHTGN